MSYNFPITTFQYLFVGIYKYQGNRIYDDSQMKAKLQALGNSVGRRIYEVVCAKKKVRETKFEDVLKFIHLHVWAYLFETKAMDLQKAENVENTWLFYDKTPYEERYVSTTAQASYFTAGILEGCLQAAEFSCRIQVNKRPEKDYYVYIIIVDEESLRKEELKK